jgi:alcohol dehydrogenase
MLALALNPTPRLVPNWPMPVRQPGEALIRVRLAGICGTDLALIRGYKGGYQGILGHEFVGEVVEADDPAWLGRRVVGEINLRCGACDFCRENIPNHCRHRMVLGITGRDGALAEYLTLPIANLHRVPDGMPDQVAVFCEPVAAACQVTSEVHVCPELPAVVIGDGKLGLLVAQVLAAGGAEVTLVGHHPERLALAKEWGLLTETRDDGYRLVVECAGNPSGLRSALDLVRPRGIIVLKSTYAESALVDLTSMVVNEVRLVGTRCGPFGPALRLLATGSVRVGPLVEATYPLCEGMAALEHAGRRGALKVLVRP